MKRNLDKITAACAAEFGVTARALTSGRRDRIAVLARHCAIKIAYELGIGSTTQIGQYFHRDHTTVLHAIIVFGERMADDPALASRHARLLGHIAAVMIRADDRLAAADEIGDLVTRLVAGLTARLQPLVDEDPIAVLKALARIGTEEASK